MKIPAYFLHSARCEGIISRRTECGKIFLCEWFSTNEIERGIEGVVTRRFSGVRQEIPVGVTEHLDVLEEGDTVILGERGIELLGVELKPVVSAFIRKQGRILLLRRSEKVGTFQGMWATVSGYIEEGDTTLSRARKEIAEETGIRKVRLLRKGDYVLARGGNRVFAVHPFLFETEEDVILDWEHTEYVWIAPEEITNFHTVPKLADALRKVI
ncbi:MAG: NUDIX domain-containing protein [Thermoplasmata archaeon]